MEELDLLLRFLRAAQDDARLGPTHVSVFVALFGLYLDRGKQDLFPIRRSEVMERAKILGIATYHKCMKDLCTYAYIHYVPSYSLANVTVVSLYEKI